jgi:phosphoglycerate kinase
MNLRTLDSFDLKGKKVLLRIDINSEISKGRILDSPRFDEAAQTIKELLKKKVKLVIIAHQGRKGDSDFFPLKQHAKILSKYSKNKIRYVDSLFEDKALRDIDSLKPGQAILLKNVREYEDEKNVNDQNNRFIELSKRFDYFVNDAFSVCHREAASIVLPPRYLQTMIGRGMEKEINSLDSLSVDKKECIFFIGGMKIQDYIPLFDLLKEKKNKIVTSGVLANMFLLAQGDKLDKEESWLKERGLYSLLPQILELKNKYPTQIIVPIDVATGDKIRKEYSISDFPRSEKIWDVGAKTIELYKNELASSKIVFIKGPLGLIEKKIFAKGTVEILKTISNFTKKKNLFSIVGGGHLTTTLKEYKIKNNFSHMSSSGGALIAYISGKKMPGLEAIYQSKHS